MVNEVAKWDGTTWAPLGSGMSGALSPVVEALLTFDDGGGAKLYAAGWFTSADGHGVNHIAKWDGATWAAIPGGSPPVQYVVRALTTLDDGTGPALYTTSDFGGDYVHKWDGTTWTQLGLGLDSRLFALGAYDDGSGPALYVGGDFDVAGRVVATGIARWYVPSCPGP